jgi:hypothetical protein
MRIDSHCCSCTPKSNGLAGTALAGYALLVQL